MTGRDVLIALISSVIAGLAVWIIQQAYTNRRERRRDEALKTIKSVNEHRMLSDSILWTLGPGRSVALMREMLGVPDIFRRFDNPIFSEEEIKTNSYLYLFKNAHVKVTSKDNDSIDSITLIDPDSSLSADVLLLSEGAGSTKFGEFQVWPGLAEGARNHKHIRTLRDSFFALEESTGPPTNQCYTFFGYSEQSQEYERSGDPKVFVGDTIAGVCVSYNDEDVFYIYDYEYR